MKSHSTEEIKTVYEPPYKLDFIDFINCPVCDFKINVHNKIVDNASFASCENCEHIIKFKLVKV